MLYFFFFAPILLRVVICWGTYRDSYACAYNAYNIISCDDICIFVFLSLSLPFSTPSLLWPVLYVFLYCIIRSLRARGCSKIPATDDGSTLLYIYTHFRFFLFFLFPKFHNPLAPHYNILYATTFSYVFMYNTVYRTPAAWNTHTDTRTYMRVLSKDKLLHSCVSVYFHYIMRTSHEKMFDFHRHRLFFFILFFQIEPSGEDYLHSSRNVVVRILLL